MHSTSPKPIPSLTDSDISRFEAFVDRRGPDECWPWTGGTQKGYGVFQAQGRALKSNRVAFAIANGFSPKNYACHSCDNPPCCNPRHLFDGTSRDNQIDCISKGRNNPPRGRRASGCKLTEELVAEIRTKYETRRFKQSKLAELYGVSRRTISAIIRGKIWKHVPILRPERMRITNQLIGDV